MQSNKQSCNAVATCQVPHIQFHSLYISKSYANPITKPKPNTNPNHNPNPTTVNTTNPNCNSRPIKTHLFSTSKSTTPSERRHVYYH